MALGVVPGDLLRMSRISAVFVMSATITVTVPLFGYIPTNTKIYVPAVTWRSEALPWTVAALHDGPRRF